MKGCIEKVVIIPLFTSIALKSPKKGAKYIQHVQSSLLLRAKVYLSAVKSQNTLFLSLSPVSLLLGVIQRSNEIIVDDKQLIFGRQSVSLLNFFVAEDIVHFLLNFVATWNPPFKFIIAKRDSSLHVEKREQTVAREPLQKHKLKLDLFRISHYK